MPDILTGPEELEISEAIAAYRTALERLDPANPDHRDSIAGLQALIDINTLGLENEVPSPRLCTCNPPVNLKCEFGHLLGPDGFCANPPEYRPLAESV